MKNLLFLFIVFLPFTGSAQVAWMEPADATVDSAVTIYFDATQGDQGLMGYEGDVYAHTGVITLESANDSDWKHVVAGWGTADDQVLMDSIGEDLYSISFHIQSFYGIAEDETVLKLAFVFRNADGSVSARNADGSDIFIPLEVNTDWQYQSYINNSEGLTVETSGGDIYFRPFNNAIQTEILPSGAESSESYAVVADPENSTFTIDTTANEIIAVLNEWQLIIEKPTLKIHFITNDTLTTLKSFFTGGETQGGLMSFSLGENAKVYGGGSRALPYNLKGYTIDFYNQAHYGYSNQTTNLNLSIPLLATNRQFAWLFDNHHPGSADIGAGSTEKLTYQAESGTLRFYLMANNNYRGFSGTLADLTGHAPLPPIWGLGYIQSRYGYQTQDEAEQVVAQMRSANFPMDVLVLDLYWFGGTSHMGDFYWDYTNFPEPSTMIQDFQSQGIETILITEPYFTLESDLYDEAASLNHFGENENNEPYVLYGFWAGDAALFDMSSADARNWLWPHYENLFDMGVSGLWTDLGEPESHPADMIHDAGTAHDVHNIFNNMWAKMLNNQTQQYDTEKRLFNLTRSGYTGMQRFSTYPWSGDIQRSFEGLQAQVPIMLHMGMSGIGYMHSDLGGFTGGGQNAELYTRWMQLGTFSPVMRAHGTGVPPEPIYYDEATQNRVRSAIKMRYRFLPYNYSLAWQYSQNGVPPARPMNYYCTEPSPLDETGDQYLWGKDVLVAPVLSEGQTSRMVTLPRGKWANYNEGTLHSGNNTISVAASIESIPVFLRQGGFVVETREHLMHTKNYSSDSIRIRHVLPADGAATERTWYHDDGFTAGNVENNAYNLIRMTGNTAGASSSVTLEMETQNITSPERHMEMMFYGLDNPPEAISINQNDVPVVDSELYNNTQPAAHWDGSFLYVHFYWRDTTTTIHLDRDPDGLAMGNTVSSLQLIANPNPLQANTKISAWVSQPGQYNLTLYGIDGQIAGNVQFKWGRGKHTVPFERLGIDKKSLQAGVYILRLSNKSVQTQLKLISYD